MDRRRRPQAEETNRKTHGDKRIGSQFPRWSRVKRENSVKTVAKPISFRENGFLERRKATDQIDTYYPELGCISCLSSEGALLTNREVPRDKLDLDTPDIDSTESFPIILHARKRKHYAISNTNNHAEVSVLPYRYTGSRGDVQDQIRALNSLRREETSRRTLRIVGVRNAIFVFNVTSRLVHALNHNF
jgi:hypothetical protein